MGLTKPKFNQIDSLSTNVLDPLLEINSALSDESSNANDLGIICERGSTGNNVAIIWDESADEFVLVLTTDTGLSSGNITFSSYAKLHVGQFISSDLSYPTSDGSTGDCLITNGSGTLSFDTRLADVIDDTTPQLGGNLDVNGKSILATSGNLLTLTTSGAGAILANGQIIIQQGGVGGSHYFRSGDSSGTGTVNLILDGYSGGSDNGYLKYDNNLDVFTVGAGGLARFDLGSDLNVNGQSLVSVSNGDITLSPDGTGNVLLGNYEFNADQSVTGLDGYVLTFNESSGEIELAAAAGGGEDYFADNYSGTLPVASGTDALAIGRSSYATNTQSVCIGYTAYSSSPYAVAIGSSVTTGDYGVAIGNSISGSLQSVSLGYNTDAWAYSVSIGYNAANQNYGVSIGHGSISKDGVSIGYNAHSSVGQSTVIGTVAEDASSSGYGVCIGRYAKTYGSYGIAIGANTRNDGERSVSIATNNTATTTAATYGIVIGYHASLYNTNCIAIGQNAYCTNTSTDSISIGYDATSYDLYGVALGYESRSYDENTTALGHQALRYNQSAVATGYANTTGVGYDSRVSSANQVQLGNSATTTYAYGAVQDRSDERDKTDITDIELGLEFINNLRPVNFIWDYREDYYDYKMKRVVDENGDPVYTDGEMIVDHDDNPTLDENGYIIYDQIQEIKPILVPIEKDGSRKRKRKHNGLIAQEVKAVMDEMGVDFAGYQDHSINGGLDVKSIGYQEFIPIIIKAIQELNNKIQDLENRLGD